MTKIIYLLKLLLLILAILILHIFVINFFPYPFDHINIIIIFLLGLVIWPNQPNGVWLILSLAWLSELLSAIPFGIDILALISTFFIMSWLFRNVLTNRSVYMTFLLSLLGILIYRLIFFSLLFAAKFLSQTLVINKQILIDTGWEILLTSIATFISYLFSYKLIKRINPSYIFVKKKSFYG